MGGVVEHLMIEAGVQLLVQAGIVLERAGVTAEAETALPALVDRDVRRGNGWMQYPSLAG